MNESNESKGWNDLIESMDRWMKWNEMTWNEMKWMNEWMNEWLNEWMNEWMN